MSLYEDQTEAEVQYALAKAFEEAGYTVYLERNFPLPNYEPTKRKKEVRQLRVDIVVALHDEVVLLVEVKKKGRTKERFGFRQDEKYRSLGLPWCYCFGIEDIPKVLERVK